MKIFRNQKAGTACIVFYVLLCLAWTLKALWLNPVLSQVIERDSVSWYLISDGIIKNLCWTLPAVLLIRKYDDDLYLHQKELFSFSTDWKSAFLVFAGVTAYCVAISVISHKGFYFDSGNLTKCLAFVFVGITEEFVFRGFLLNATITEENKIPAVLINGVLFLCIHFPKWITHGEFITNFSNFGFVTIILLGAFFGWLMLKYRNIWIPVIVHMLWDVLVTVLN